MLTVSSAKEVPDGDHIAVLCFPNSSIHSNRSCYISYTIFKCEEEMKLWVKDNPKVEYKILYSTVKQVSVTVSIT